MSDFAKAIALVLVATPLTVFFAVYAGVVAGLIPDEQGQRHRWLGARIEVGEVVRYLIGVAFLAAIPFLGALSTLRRDLRRPYERNSETWI